jgi:hypothetical protein
MSPPSIGFRHPSAASTANALSDAVFQLLASRGGLSHAGAVALPGSTNFFDLPTTLPSAITPLARPATEQASRNTPSLLRPANGFSRE